MSADEVNFDGLIGPTHNYGGLSDGNLAALSNKGQVSNPREAALQGLEKMRLLVREGLVQGFLPPQSRPCYEALRWAGFVGDERSLIEQAAKRAPTLLLNAYSASSMWAANAATVSPSADTHDSLLHLTVANLSTMLHRSLEHRETEQILKKVFADPDRFVVHTALPQAYHWSDEGAANHVRLCAEHDENGVELFVYGRDASERPQAGFPARQSRLASATIARNHGLSAQRIVFARQGRRAIDAGAFHNDVVCVGTLSTLFFHEFAFEDREQTLEDVRRASDGLFEPNFVEVKQADVPIEDAISSYLFNSQLLAIPGSDRLMLLAPTETELTETTRAYCESLVQSNGPIGTVRYVDVRQSMRNGGGPACLRLRVVMDEAEQAMCDQAFLLDESRIDQLQEFVRDHYRDRLEPSDLADPSFADEVALAMEALNRLLQ